MSDSQPIVSIEPISPTATTSVVASNVPSVVSSIVVEQSDSTATRPGNPPERLAHAENVPASWLWMNKYDQLFVGVFATVFLALSGYHWATLGEWGMRPIELDRLPARQYDFRIDINSASWVEWTQVEGIGEVTAQKIIADRDSNGPFRKIDELRRVKRIGPKMLEKMRPFLREPNEQAAKIKAKS